MGYKVLIWLLKATKAAFGSENFTKAILVFVENKQTRKNEEHEERKAVRVEDAKGDLLRKKNRTDRLEHRTEKRATRRDQKKNKRKGAEGGDAGVSDGTPEILVT